MQSAGKLAGGVAVVSGTYAESRGRAGLRRVLAARSIDASGDDPRAHYIDVTIRGRLSTGMVAIGGETTGVTIAADAVRWELEVSPRQQNLVRRLNGRNVLVSGELTNRRGIELPNRYVVSVRRLERTPEQP